MIWRPRFERSTIFGLGILSYAFMALWRGHMDADHALDWIVGGAMPILLGEKPIAVRGPQTTSPNEPAVPITGAKG